MVQEVLREETNVRKVIIHDGEAIYFRKILRGLNSFHDAKELETEVQALQNLNHPAIPRLVNYSLGEEISLTREYKPGKSLREYLDGEKMFSERETRDIAHKVLDLFTYIHQQGIVHRDIKPSNLIYDEATEQVYLVDFGLARLRYFAGTTSSTTGGTFSYMAPEQYFGKAYPASDIFGLGATLVELLTGNSLERYLAGESIFQGFDLARLQISPNLKEILTKMTRADVRERYQSAQEVAADLRVPFPTVPMLARSRQLAARSNGQTVKANGLPPSLDELMAEAMKLLEGQEIGYSMETKLNQTIEELAAVLGYEAVKVLQFQNQDNWKMENATIYAQERPDDSLKLLVHNTSAGSLRYVHLKQKRLFDKFCKNISIYIGPKGTYEQGQQVQVPLPEKSIAINDHYNSIGNRETIIFAGGIILVAGVGLGGLITGSLLGALAGLSPGASIVTGGYFLRRHKKKHPPTFTPEQIEQWKPYQGRILVNQEALQALYRDFWQQREQRELTETTPEPALNP